MLKPVLEGRPQTAVVLAQNGILIEEEFAEVYPPNPILSGVVYCPAVQTGPGNIDYPDMLSNLQLGTFPADSPAEHKAAADAFVQLMIKGGRRRRASFRYPGGAVVEVDDECGMEPDICVDIMYGRRLLVSLRIFWL